MAFGCGKKGETLSPSNQEIVESVYASAKIKAYQQYSQKVSIGGKLLNYLVSEGDLVKAGQSIAQLENFSPELTVKNAQLVFDIFKQLTKEFNTSLLIVTHDADFASKTDRIIEMADGEIVKI